MTLSRREAVRRTGIALAATLGAPMINRGRFRLFAASVQEYSARAMRLVAESPVIDMLMPLNVSGSIRERWLRDPSSFTAADAELFRSSGIDVMHIAVGVGGRDWPSQRENVWRFINAHNGFVASHDEVFLRIDDVSDIDRARETGKIGVLIGVQNSDHFWSPDDVATFHAAGQRVSQLTYNEQSMLGAGSTERRDGGVTDTGVAIIGRMNEVGMAVDVSHSGDVTTLDACEVSKRPVLFTHSNVRVLSGGHPRTKTDEAIRAMARTGGVMGITGVRMFVKPDEPTTIEHMLDHYDHVRDLVGVEHLGVGSDIDLHGYDDMPAEEYARLKAAYDASYAFRDKIDIDEVAHPKRMYDLTEGLIRRGYSDEAIGGILGGNFRRVLGEIWSVQR